MKGVVLLGLALSMVACSVDMSFRMGHHPDPTALERRLRIGESSTVDVAAALGPPDGKGEAMLPMDQRRLVMWLYNYNEIAIHLAPPITETADPRALIMFVFFHENTYQGYLWASSLPKEARGKSDAAR